MNSCTSESERAPRYSGNGAYCYANSLHMSLRASGADPGWLPEPGFLECLTTMPFGNSYFRFAHGPMVFFSPPSLDPGLGLDRALDTLGWSWDIEEGGDEEAARARLARASASSPLLCGPIDMGDITYNPRHLHVAGADHFVLVLGVEEDRVRLHDPEGYPFASIPVDDFLRSWRADRIGYPHKPFTGRYDFREEERRSRAEMIEQALPLARANLVDDPGGPERYGGVRALGFLAEDLKGKVSQYLAGHLTWFAFPLAARRCADAAAFMEEGGSEGASRLLQDKARLFGEAQYLGVQGRWASVSGTISGIAAVEDRLTKSL